MRGRGPALAWAAGPRRRAPPHPEPPREMRTGSLIASLVLGASLTSSAARPPSPAAAPAPTAAAPASTETRGAAAAADTGRVLARSDRALL